MQGRYAIHAPLLIKTLLQHYMEQKKAPPGLYGNNGGNSIVLGIAGRYSFVFQQIRTLKLNLFAFYCS